MVNGYATKSYVDFGSTCNIIKLSLVNKIGLKCDYSKKKVLVGYGNNRISTLGSCQVGLTVDNIEIDTVVDVVPDHVQEIPVLIGQPVTESAGVLVVKDSESLTLMKRNVYNIDTDATKVIKVVLRVKNNVVALPDSVTHVQVYSESNFEGDAYIEASLRLKEGQEYCIPRLVIEVRKHKMIVIPVINLSNSDIVFKKDNVVVRAMSCIPEPNIPEERTMLIERQQQELNPTEIKCGALNQQQREALENLLSSFTDCFASDFDDLGCAKSAELEINLSDDTPFYYRPYRMSKSEQDIVQSMVDQLLGANIIKESDSPYSSPVLLVKKKDGESRLCIDYRRLNQKTVKDRYPLPRIDDQLDRLHGCNYFTALDLRSGYYQIPVSTQSKKYTAFVTPEGHFEFNRMPFGLSNAPSVFQRLMNKILAPAKNIAAVYLDDILIHTKTIEEGLENLKTILELLRKEGLKLKLSKCSFLMTSITYLGFEISNGRIRPGELKIKSVQEFAKPESVRNVRQFLGLTGYFRHFIKDYALLAKPLTALLKKDSKWQWTEKEEHAFMTLKERLITRPTLALYVPNGKTEVHTDASSHGVAGILMQQGSDGKMHPVAYYSRQTNAAEVKYHSYELETLAVVESLKKFRTYLVGIKFEVITDCNALKATSAKKQLLPRIARWWLQLQEYDFTVQYRPGNRMKHVDALSRNPSSSEEPPEETVFRIQQADWVLSAQLTDAKIEDIRKVLSKPPQTDYERGVYKNYALRNGRVYRITAKGIQWVVPRGMRQHVVRAAHDEMGHFGIEKTLYRLCEHYWFPKMRDYVQRYISCCISCLFNKKTSGRKEGFMHPIEKPSVPFRMVHIDHLGPFPKSKQGNVHLIVLVDAFTKYVIMKPVKTTKIKYVIRFLEEIVSLFGAPSVLISDRGSCYTSKKFHEFCLIHSIKHVLNATATPRANGQVERFNRTIHSALLTLTSEEDEWDKSIAQVQFAINNVPAKSTNKTPSELLYGYKPRGGSDIQLVEAVTDASVVIGELLAVRKEASQRIMEQQELQRQQFDKKRKAARKYKEGDLVMIEKVGQPLTGTSRKLIPPYAGPMIVKKVLDNDRYVVTDMEGSTRTRGKKYENVAAVDKMKPWILPQGVSDESDDDYNDDDDGIVQSDPDKEGSEEESPRGEV